MSNMRKAKTYCVSVDSEYSSTGELLTLGVATKEDAKAAETSDKQGMRAVAAILRKASVVCGHSIGGDLDHLVRLGLAKETWLQGVDVKDSLLLARMCEENGARGTYALENLMLAEFNVAPWKAETEKLIKKTGNAADWTPEQRIERCRLDAWATVVLAEHFERRLLDDEA